jgi:ATP-dependent Lon protease
LKDIHVHFPEGSTPKDGPSAGCAITTALLSLALNQPIPQDIGMTGEISLNGKVLPIGGVKEKTMAAGREGVNTLIFPKANEKDIKKLPEYIKEGITFHFAEDYMDVFKIVFPNVKIEN